jgi:hypothetical protein
LEGKLYKLERSESEFEFSFFSDGPIGRIQKRIIFRAFQNNPDVYNLGFGDVQPDGTINDLFVSGNLDNEAVFRSIAMAAYTFFHSYPDKSVFAQGSTPSRTRLYRMMITKNLKKITERFYVFGLLKEQWESFIPGRDYQAFLIQRKKSIFE